MEDKKQNIEDFIFIFYENKKMKAMYTDVYLTKKDIINYIVQFHLDRKFAQNKKECVKMLFKKISALFDFNQNYMDSLGYNWNLVKIKKNCIHEIIDTPKYKTKYTKLNIKANDLTKRDWDMPVEYLSLGNFYE